MFTKESNLNKAREHSLLVSKRPPYVTILTLVRDAAARLPNGEGTRAEVRCQSFCNLPRTTIERVFVLDILAAKYTYIGIVVIKLSK